MLLQRCSFGVDIKPFSFRYLLNKKLKNLDLQDRGKEFSIMNDKQASSRCSANKLKCHG